MAVCAMSINCVFQAINISALKCIKDALSSISNDFHMSLVSPYLPGRRALDASQMRVCRHGGPCRHACSTDRRQVGQGIGGGSADTQARSACLCLNLRKKGWQMVVCQPCSYCCIRGRKGLKVPVAMDKEYFIQRTSTSRNREYFRRYSPLWAYWYKYQQGVVCLAHHHESVSRNTQGASHQVPRVPRKLETLEQCAVCVVHPYIGARIPA